MELLHLDINLYIKEIKIEKKRREIVVKLDLLDQNTNFSDNDNKSKTIILFMMKYHLSIKHLEVI